MPIPKKIPPPPRDFTSEKGIELADSLQIMLPKELGLSDVAAKNKLKTKNYSWQSPKELSDYIKEVTGQGSIKDAEYVLSQWQENFTEIPEYESTMTGAPEYGVDSNTISPDQLKQFQEDLETIEEKRKETVTSQESNVRTAIKRQQEIYSEQLKRVEAAKEKFEKETRFVKAKKAKLDQDQQAEIENLKQQSKANPKETVEKVSQEIQARLGDSVPKAAADLAALEVVTSFQSGSTPAIYTAVTQTVSKEVKASGDKDVAEWINSMYDASQARVGLAKDIAANAFGSEFSDAAFPQVDVSTSPKSGYVPVSLAYIPNEASKIMEHQGKVLDNPFLKETDYADIWFGSQLELLNGDGSEVQGSVAFTRFRPRGRVDWEGMNGPRRLNMATGAGDALKAVGGLAGGAIKKVATKAITSKITAALGTTVAGPVGTAVGLAVGEFISRILDSKFFQNLKKWSAAVTGGLAFLISLPFIGLGGALGIGVGTAALSFGLGGGLGGLTLGGIGAGLGGFFVALAGATLGAIGPPILFILLGFPVIIALILFIINSGAYVVPESSLTSLRGQDNPYIMVTKVASPDKISNPSSLVTVSYTVTITALKNPLTNLKITDTSCTVTKRDGSGADCPIEEIEDLPEGLTIAPSNPYSFSFTVDYGPRLSDSLVFDSVTVTGDATEEQGISTTGSETVCVGDCPTSCVKVVDTADPWPGNIRSITEEAAVTVASKYPGLAAKYCSEGEVNLCFKPAVVDVGGWHVHNRYGDGCDVYFKAGVLQSPGNAEFMLGHELTHHIQAISGAESEYVQSGALSELPLCSYAATTEKIEGMAEAIGLYVSIPSWGGCVGNYRTKYPKNYNFAKGFVE